MKKIGLAIDTTFDDTSVAIIEGERNLLANSVLSQYADHAEFGGVVPERASRKHIEAIHPLIQASLKEAQLTLQDLDWIAASNMPGLIGPLMVGITTAKTLAFGLNIPFIGINHIEAHPYANFLVHKDISYPLLHLVAAGGHTLILEESAIFQMRIIGRSIDDAAGECVDKAARMFNYAMPGGRQVDELAQKHPRDAYNFPRPMPKGLNLSFSGLKTALLYHVRDHGTADAPAVLASFLQSVIDVLTYKVFKAARQFPQHQITLSGGLCASQCLREAFYELGRQNQVKIYCPPPALCTDNAAMVACLAAKRFKHGLIDNLQLSCEANLPAQLHQRQITAKVHS